MATLRKKYWNTKDGKSHWSWAVNWTYKGRRFRKVLGTQDRRLADAHLSGIKVQIVKGNLDLQEHTTKILLSEFIKEYLEYLKINRSNGTFKKARHVWGDLLDFLGDRILSTINSKSLEDFKAHKLNTVRPASINSILPHMKAGFNKAIEWEKLKSNPMKNVKGVEVKEEPLRVLSTTEIRNLLETIEQDSTFYHSLYSFLLYSGVRSGEASRLAWYDINFEGKTIVLQITKNKRIRFIPITPKIEQILKTVPQNGKRVFPVSVSWISHRFKRYLRQAGIDSHYRVHDLRHTFGTYLASSGVDLLAIKDLLGHSQLSTVLIYTHSVPEHLRESAQKLPY